MLVLGLNDGPNASACLLQDGIVTHCIQEERLSRVKNHSCFPYLAIETIFRLANISANDVDFITCCWNHLPKNLTREQLLYSYAESSSTKTVLKRLLKHTKLMDLYKGSRKRERTEAIKRMDVEPEKIEFVEHHLCHASVAYYCGPLSKEDKVLVLTNDGGGDGLCATVNIGENGKLTRIAQVPVEESIGYLYSMITFILGMVPEEHEYKIMGMAPYASREKSSQVFNKFARIFEFSEDGLTWSRQNGCPPTQYSLNFCKSYFAYDRFDLLCHGVQSFTEDFLVQWVKNCIKKTNIHKVVLSGGVFMNVKANKRIMELPEVESLYISPSCGDESNSMGAACQKYAHELQKNNLPVNIQPLGPLYLGPEFSDEAIEEQLTEQSLLFDKKGNIEKDVALLLSKGHVVARFKGRMEFGSRALGNRSLLADPVQPGVKKRINEMIKNRDFWMPFAPSMLDYYADKYVVNPKKCAAPYMMLSFDSTDKLDDFKAATHPYDGTARPQIVEEKWNPDYYKLLQEFEKLTGRGAILNTSFNLHGYPIVCSPEDAIDVFTKSGLEYLAIGNYLVHK